jgi:galactose mutarotase-like enzyme
MRRIGFSSAPASLPSGLCRDETDTWPPTPPAKRSPVGLFLAVHGPLRFEGTVLRMKPAAHPDPVAAPPERPAEVVQVENASLCVSVLPERGGKLTSLRTRPDGLEWLHPPLRPYAQARSDGAFEQSDAGGWDECLPSVAGSTGVPDHGDLWRLPWSVTRQGQGLQMSADALSAPLRFHRHLSLNGSALALRYRVENIGSGTAEFVYSAHPLLQVEEGDRILLPPSVTSLRVESSAGERLGPSGARCGWPLAYDSRGREVNLSRVGPADGATAEKLFAGPLAEGWCALYRARLRRGIVFRWDAAVLPYVGLWISLGAWPASSGARQYTVAIEPSNAACDSLDTARSLGLATALAAGQSVTWSMEVGIVGEDRGMAWEQFRAVAGRQV